MLFARGGGRAQCFDAGGSDPLYDADLPPLSEQPELTAFLSDVVDASSRVIMLDRLLDEGDGIRLAITR